MTWLAHVASFALCLLSFTAPLFAQIEKPATGSITRRITFAEQPIPGLTVTLESARANSNTLPNLVSAKTDADGRYRLTGLAAGNYVVSPSALAYALPMDGGSWRPGKNINLSDGETIENFDFALIKGGVIAGMITDSNGRAIIGRGVQLTRVEDIQIVRSFRYGNYRMYDTDDRGTYRIFGLPAGRYKVSLGEGEGTLVIGRAGGFYRLTYYPGVAAEADAKIIELKEGCEITDVDFQVRPPEKTYDAKGRLVDGTTGAPLAGFNIARSALAKGENNINSYGYSPDLTDANGEFVMRGLWAGRYAVFPTSPTIKEYYSDPTVFEVTNSDVEGLEVKAYRGATINGVVVIEGTNEPAVQRLLPRVNVGANMQATTLQAPSNLAQANPDGTFRLAGLRPGKARLSAYATDNSPLMLVRVERDGVPLSDGIELTGAEQISGVKIVLVYGSSTLRGQVNIVGGTLPPDTRLFVWANHSSADASRSIQVDTRGRFVLENLAPGEYRLSISQSIVSGNTTINPRPTFMQNVTIGASETTITLTLDLNAKKEAK